tara:strand:+ start:96 stop:281 length:186 start_codon:yes stop_codon:yes gene_type:complete
MTQAAHDAQRQTKPVEFIDWCLENGRRYIGAKNYAEFEKNAKDYEAYRAEFFALKDKEIAT